MKVLRIEIDGVANSSGRDKPEGHSFRRFWKRNWKTRHWFQFAVLLATLVTGLRFLMYVSQAGGEGPITLSRPAGGGRILPIGALISWKRFFLTGIWDTIHPAAMIIFGFAIILSLLAHKAFCAWFCPVGTISEWCWRVGRQLFGQTLTVPKWLDIPLRLVKYILLGFFVWITGAMSPRAITAFINTPYYKISDVKMLYFFTRMTVLTAVVLVILVVGSMVIKNFWCRYFCPYGALTGIVSLFSPLRVRRNDVNCIHCGKCSKACPHRIDVMDKKSVMSPECSGCLDCVEVCPTRGALAFQLAERKKPVVSPLSLGIWVMLSFSLVCLIAAGMGYWESSLSELEFRQLIRIVDHSVVSHPGL